MSEPLNEPLVKNLQIKVTEQEFKELTVIAKSNSRTLSNWGRLILLKQIKQ